MQSSRRLLASAPSGGKPAGAWEGFKSAVKARFMIGDTYEHYVPPRPQFLNRDSKYDTGASSAFRLPAPGSQPEAVVPRGYPETEFNISLAKRASLQLSPSGGVSEQLAEKERMPLEDSNGKQLPRHVPMPAWMFQRSQLKAMRRVYLETGQWPIGMTNRAVTNTYRPVLEFGAREEWSNVEVIRDIRKPRI